MEVDNEGECLLNSEWAILTGKSADIDELTVTSETFGSDTCWSLHNPSFTRPHTLSNILYVNLRQNLV